MNVNVFNVALALGWALILAGGCLIDLGWGLWIAGLVLLGVTLYVARIVGVALPSPKQKGDD